jgi:uncharacterized membrane protein
MRHAWACTVVVLTSLAWGGAASAQEEPPSYSKDVKPFLTQYCLKCHNDARPRSGYSVETFAGLTREGKRGALVVPEKPDASRLLLTMAGKGRAMPPRRSAQPKPDEVARVRAWIEAGARDDTPAADDKKKSPTDPGR